MGTTRSFHHSDVEKLEDRRLLTVSTSTLPGLTFESAQVFSPPGVSGKAISATEYADLDGDGNRDLIYAISSVNGFSVALSSGAGTFQTPSASSEIRQQVLQLHAEDVDRDDVIDLIAASQTRVYTLLGQSENGDWSGFRLVSTITAPTNSIAVGDVDRDGNVDLVLAKTHAAVYSGVGDGTFVNPIEYVGQDSDERRAQLSDVDSDGDGDLVVAGFGGIKVLRNDAGIFESELDSIDVPNNVRLTIGDANGDSTLDLWVSLGNAEHSFAGLFIGNGDGTFDKNVQKYETLGPALDMKLADMNGDSRIDLVIGHDNTFHHPVNNNGPGGVSILLANNTGSFHDAIRITTPNGSQVYVDDTNSDGVPDIVTSHWQTVNVYHQVTISALQHESTAFRLENGNLFGSNVQFAAGDVNGDSHLDFAVASYDWAKEVGQLELLLGSPTGEYQSRVMPLPKSTASVHIANVDGDLDAEVLVHMTDFSRSTFVVVDVDARDEFLPTVETRLRSSWNVQSRIDANGDGITDFVGAADGKTRLLLGSSSGQFTDQLISNESGYRTPPIVDFNNDGIADIAIQGGEGFRVLLGDGEGAFAESYQQSFQFPSIGVGDFDGDGNFDLVFTNFSDKKLHIVHGSGDGTFESKRLYDRVENSEFYVADFNNDGKSDLLFDSYDKFEIHIRVGDSFEPLGGQFALPHSIRQVTELDIDSDGLNEFVLAPGLDFSTPQAQISVLDLAGIDSTTKLTTTTFSNTIVSATTVQDMNMDGVVDALAAASLNGFFIVELNPSVRNGDVNKDGETNLDDVDLLCQQLHTNEAADDLNGDGVVDQNDVDFLVEVILHSAIGDVTGDGQFDSSDFVEIFQTSEYEDNIPGNSLWSEGDWNCDGDFSTADFVYAFQKGSYVASAKPIGRIAGAIADKVFADQNDRNGWKTRGDIV